MVLFIFCCAAENKCKLKMWRVLCVSAAAAVIVGSALNCNIASRSRRKESAQDSIRPISIIIIGGGGGTAAHSEHFTLL
jgi:hypothetical protein